MVLMSAEGWNAPALAEAFNCHEHTVRTTIKTYAKTKQLTFIVQDN